MKKVLGVYGAPRPHWVGDGFPVRSLFSHVSHDAHVSPLLLLDYAGSADLPSADKPRGVATHPHRGFETVTIATRARSSIAIPLARGASSVRAMCSG
jgi:quercetin 2,3-dioxygenase